MWLSKLSSTVETWVGSQKRASRQGRRGRHLREEAQEIGDVDLEVEGSLGKVPTGASDISRDHDELEGVVPTQPAYLSLEPGPFSLFSVCLMLLPSRETGIKMSADLLGVREMLSGASHPVHPPGHPSLLILAPSPRSMFSYCRATDAD